MKVEEIMSSNVKACGRGTSLAEAVSILWKNDCGVLPVVDDEGRLIGTITDRDIAIALGTKNRLASEVTVGEVMTNHVATTAPPEDVRSALQRMGDARVRRLPVISDGMLIGMLSINDIVLRAGGGRTDLSHEDIAETLKAICQHRATGAVAG
ncbi:MAG: CBS domain-containing protein [Blastocatellia bacterium AA13]|nr:MAG: CBS domain-containing protein [Blastocatellia bacterium AA13]